MEIKIEMGLNIHIHLIGAHSSNPHDTYGFQASMEKMLFQSYSFAYSGPS